MKRNWQSGPEESYSEREERINILLEELHNSIADGQSVSLEEIADYVGCEVNVIFKLEECGLKKLRQACDPDERLLLLDGFQSLLQRSEGMAAIMELWEPKSNL